MRFFVKYLIPVVELIVLGEILQRLSNEPSSEPRKTLDVPVKESRVRSIFRQTDFQHS